MDYYVTYYRRPYYEVGDTPEQRREKYEASRNRRSTFLVQDRRCNYSLDYALLKQLYGHDVCNLRQQYTKFTIPKRTGGVRVIEAPPEELKLLQKNLLKELYKGGVLTHDCAYGFVSKRNCKQTLEVHQRNKSRWFLKMDFKNFFPSFTKEIIFKNFDRLSKLCLPADDLGLFVDAVTSSDDRLVQGAPTSPYIANLCMIPFDYAMDKYCKEHDLVYTRYADDVLISGKEKFDWREVGTFLLTTLSSLGYNTLHINPSKTRFGSSNGANWNLGIMYNQELNLTVGHKTKHLAKIIAHKWDTLSDEEKATWRGKFAYYRAIEPEYFSQERFAVLN